jgi:hypothetical protein
LIQNVINFIILDLAAPVATLLIAWAGIKLMINAESEDERKKAKQLLKDILVGFLWILFAWFVVILIMDTLVSDSIKGPGSSWFKIQCDRAAYGPLDTAIDQPVVMVVTPSGVVGIPSSFSSTLNSTQINAGIGAVSSYDSYINSSAAKYGIDPATLKAIIVAESAGNPTAISPKGAYGIAQILPTTAQTLDPAGTKGLSIDEVKNKLTSDPAYSIDLAAKNLAEGLKKGNGDLTTANAYYNGGSNAIAPSRDCAGQLAYQCPWDSGGCYGTSNTNCTVNTGYKETRTYTANVQKIVETIKSK